MVTVMIVLRGGDDGRKEDSNTFVCKSTTIIMTDLLVWFLHSVPSLYFDLI